MVFPPLKQTTSAPASTNRWRFVWGGSCPAASTTTGTPRSWAAFTTSVEVRARPRIHHICDRRGPVGNRIGNLPGFRIPDSGAAVPVGNPNLHELNANRTDGVVVEVPVAPRDNHLVLHAPGVRQTVHPARVQPGHARRHAQHDARRRSRRDVPGLGARDVGNGPARPGLQFRDIHAMLRGFRHGLRHLRRENRPAQPCGRPGRIDYGTNTQAFINTAHPPPPELGSGTQYKRKKACTIPLSATEKDRQYQPLAAPCQAKTSPYQNHL